MILSSRDLRRLADALDGLTQIRAEHGVTPGLYDTGFTLRTEAGDDCTLRLSVRDDELVVDDRYGD